jgi:hypothetical protein
MPCVGIIDRARRHCLWRGSNANAKGKSLAAWPKVTKPKNKGGLGVVDLRSQNEALLLKHLDKFYNKKDTPWVNMIWHSHYSQGHPTCFCRQRVFLVEGPSPPL